MVGAVTGGPEGATDVDVLASGPVPLAFFARTRNLYGTPLVRPETVHESPVDVQLFTGSVLRPRAVLVTVYKVIADPSVGAFVHETETLPAPARAVTFVGSPGSPEGITVLDGGDDGPRPAPLVARTRKV
jgi:hypothetical protein